VYLHVKKCVYAETCSILGARDARDKYILGARGFFILEKVSFVYLHVEKCVYAETCCIITKETSFVTCS